MTLPLRSALRLVTVSLLVVLATGCLRSPTVLGVVIDQGDVTLAVGETLRFTGTVEVLHGASTALTWASSDTSVLSIDGSGQAVAVGVGEARVSATSAANANRSDTVTVSVRQVMLALDPPAALLLPGEQRTFTALISGADALALRWRATGGSVSSDGNVITYTAPAEPGNHRITVVSSADPDAMATAYVTVAADAERQRGRQVVIVSDPILLTHEGASERLRAVVYEDGAPVAGAAVTWESSAPAVVSVDPNGIVNAAAPVGSAIITARHGEHSDRQMVPVAQPSARTHVMLRDSVEQVEVADDEVTRVVFARDEASDAIRTGDVIVSNAGVLSRVVGVREAEDSVVADVVSATLAEAFDRIVISGTSDPLLLDVALDPTGASLGSSDRGLVTPQAFDLDGLECGFTVGRPVNVVLIDGRIDFKRHIAFTATYEKASAGSAPRLLLQAEVEARVDAFSPRVKIDAGFEGTYACTLELGAYIVPVLSFFGILNVGGNLSPRIGFELTGRVDGAGIEIAGPYVEGAGFDATVGFEYVDNEARVINETTFVAGDYGLGVFAVDTQPTVSVGMGPFLDLGLGATIDVTTIKGVGVDIATPKFATTFSVNLATPFDVEAAAYVGPRWDAAVNGSVSFGVKLTGKVAKVMKTFGVTVELAALSVRLFDPVVFLRSPALPVTLSTVDVASSVEVSTAGIGSLFHGREVRFLALPDGGGASLPIGSASVTNDGSAAVVWRPSEDDNGAYTITAMLYDAIFGSLGLPYASQPTERASLSVGVGDVAVVPASIAMGADHGMALTDEPERYAWGSGQYGGLGGGTTQGARVPLLLGGLPPGTHLAAISGGRAFTLAVSTRGELFAWGYNYDGQLGDGTTSDRHTPLRIDGFPAGTRIVSVAAGYAHSLALAADGAVYAWGENNRGQLGDGTMTDRHAPVRIEGFAAGTRIVALAAGYQHSLALTSDGEVYAWGSNHWLQLGDGSGRDQPTPVRIDGFPAEVEVVAIAAGFRHSLALTSAGRLYTWGDNEYGQLATGSLGGYRETPWQVWNVASGTIFTAVSAGDHHGMALTETGDLFAWGNNRAGQLGDGTRFDRGSPTRITDLPPGTTFSAVAAGGYSSLGSTSDGVLYSWGSGLSGRLGLGTKLAATTVPTIMLTRGASSGTLTLEVGVGGRVTSTDGRIDCDAGGGACSTTYTFAGHGAAVPSVTLTAQADAGKRAQWLDACEGSDPITCVINMVADRTASVRFIADTVTRSLSVDVVGSGRVTSSDGRIDCRATGGSCSASYTYVNTAPNVTLTATPDANNSFTRWTGSCFGSQPTCSLNMAYSHSVGASFVDERDQQLSVCEVWSAAQSGGAGTTTDTWDISMIPQGAAFDIRFDALNLPDRFVVTYPSGTTVLDTGWRGSSAYEGDPDYPGGIAGPGQGQVDGMFTRSSQDSFTVIVTGPDPDTAWDYQVRCRE